MDVSLRLMNSNSQDSQAKPLTHVLMWWPLWPHITFQLPDGSLVRGARTWRPPWRRGWSCWPEVGTGEEVPSSPSPRPARGRRPGRRSTTRCWTTSPPSPGKCLVRAVFSTVSFSVDIAFWDEIWRKSNIIPHLTRPLGVIAVRPRRTNWLFKMSIMKII